MNKKSTFAQVLPNALFILLALFLIPKTIFAQTDSVVKVKIPTVVLLEKKSADFVQLPAENLPTVIDQNSGIRRRSFKKPTAKIATPKKVSKTEKVTMPPLQKYKQTPIQKLKPSLKPSTASYVLQSDSTKKVEANAKSAKQNQTTMFFVWIGSALVIAGIILGLTYNKYAFFASGAGLVLILSGILIS